MMKARLTELYRQCWTPPDAEHYYTGMDFQANAGIYVALREWRKGRYTQVDDRDYVLHTEVTIDGLTTRKKTVLALGGEQHAYIRAAIAEFDRLVENHPSYEESDDD